jgi:hypothetical protein
MDLPPLQVEHYVDEDGLWAERRGPYSEDQMLEYGAGAAKHERERILAVLNRHNWRSASIWRHYYPSATGDWVDLRELRKLLES